MTRLKLVITIMAALFGLQTLVVAKTPAEKQMEEEKRHQQKLEKLQKELEHDRQKRRRKVEELQIKAKITNEKFYYSQEEWKGRLGLTCPDQESYDRVVVSHWAANQRTHYNIVHASIVVFNNTNGPQNIFEDGLRTSPVIENLCPGGSITLERSLNLPHTNLDISWTARSIDGEVFSQSQRYNLWRPYNYGYNMRTRQTGRWCIGGCDIKGSAGTY